KLEYLPTMPFFLERFFHSTDLPPNPAHPDDELLFVPDSMSHQKIKYTRGVSAIDHRIVRIQTEILRLSKDRLKNRRRAFRKSRGVVQIAELRCLARLVDLVGKAHEIGTNSD